MSYKKTPQIFQNYISSLTYDLGQIPLLEFNLNFFFFTLFDVFLLLLTAVHVVLVVAFLHELGNEQ